MNDDNNFLNEIDQLVYCLIQATSGNWNVQFPNVKETSPLSYLVLAVQNLFLKLQQTTVSKNWFEVVLASIGDAVTGAAIVQFGASEKREAS